MDNNIYVGKYNKKFNELLGLNYQEFDIVRSKGFPSHLISHKHYKALKYIDYIPNIISNPDYIGVNPNEEAGQTLELVKCFNDNVLLGIKLDKSNNCLYVSTMYDIPKSKIDRFIHSGRLKLVIDT